MHAKVCGTLSLHESKLLETLGVLPENTFTTDHVFLTCTPYLSGAFSAMLRVPPGPCVVSFFCLIARFGGRSLQQFTSGRSPFTYTHARPFRWWTVLINQVAVCLVFFFFARRHVRSPQAQAREAAHQGSRFLPCCEISPSIEACVRTG